MEGEFQAILNGSRLKTTDQWETAHFQSMTAEFGNEERFFRDLGFGTIFSAEHMTERNGGKEYPSTFGYWDEGMSLAVSLTEEGLEYLWKYVDYTRSRNPKPRMYIGWMDSTTHTPFLLPPFWKNKTYYHDDDSWASINGWLNAVRWTDDIVKDIILGFRERGLEDETLFIM
jgi:phosphoglycerol transferase MdoB-like AlkP superfamily enzyme